MLLPWHVLRAEAEKQQLVEGLYNAEFKLFPLILLNGAIGIKRLVNSQCLGLPTTMFPVGLGGEAQYHC